VKPLNPWLESTLLKAKRLFEDSDHRTFASQRFLMLITRLNHLATTSAHTTPTPKLERFQHEDSVSLLVEWHDKESGWFLCVGLKRKFSEKPRVTLEFSGNPESYNTDNPTDDDIRKAMHDYFQEWKK